MKSRWLLVSVLLTALAFAGGICSTVTAAQKGTIIIAQAEDPGNLIPVIWRTEYDQNIEDMLYNSLVVPDKELKMVGQLAKSWDISADGRTYTFHLHKNVKWHDGAPFTARDVAFTFKSMAHPKYDMGATGRVKPIVGFADYREGKSDDFKGIKVVDDYTVQFTTDEVYAPFLASLSMGIIPEHLLKDKDPSEWAKLPLNRAPIGTGPFKFVQWKTGQYIEVAANKDYFRGAPKVDRIITRFGDVNTMLAAFISKEVDITLAPISEVASVKHVPHASIKLAAELNFYYVGLNMRNEHFKNQIVRHALAYAINKEEIVSSIIGEYGGVAHDVFPNAHWSHNPNVTKFNYNLEKAQQLLTEAGYTKNAAGKFEKDGKPLSFVFSVPIGKKEREKTAVLLKQYWDALGVDCEIRMLDFPTLISKLVPKDKAGKQRPVTADDFEAFILGYGVETDPGVDYMSYYHSKTMPPNGYNFCGFVDPKLDKLFDDQFKMTDFNQRKAAFWKIGKRLSDAQVWIPIYSQNKPYVANKRVSGFNPDFRGVTFNCEEWGLKE
ncbi:MAG: hypothetical protein HKM93_04030 [Desulfobacteraceae bacterium]|nr:hypothetical protein [Desulfobacteraceae bacterium]